MKLSNRLTLQRLIGKIDNDFNISESDWIPRVAAWTIDALSQMKILPKEKKRRVLEVSDRIAQFPCELDAKEIKVFDKNGCEIPALKDARKRCNSCSDPVSLNKDEESIRVDKDINPLHYDYPLAVFDDTEHTGNHFMRIVNTSQTNRYYVLDGNNIELSFDTDCITVETLEVATYYDDYYDTDVPYVYDDGLLLEALAWYIMFKYLSRGSKHTVFSLTSNSIVTNPWLQWNALKDKAANSVKKKLSADNNGWNNFFYNSTFLPRL